jgi:peroxiredoxin 2/4
MYRSHKLSILLVIVSFFSISQLNANITIPGIGETAPAFEADTNKGQINFPGDYQGKWVIFFSHPADFTPVCETEFKRLAQLIPELKSLNTALLGLSVDSKYIHDVWVKELEQKLKSADEVKKKIDFPIIADLDKKISKLYGMIHPEENSKQTLRAVFIIDPQSKIRAIFYYPIANGRGFKEIKRILTALQHTDTYGEATPADWQPGDKAISKKKREAEYYQ